MVRRLRWVPRALQDLREIYEYIARDSPRYARRQVERLQKAAQRLKNFPEAGRRVPEFPDRSWRELLVGNYRLVYRWHSKENQVVILAVIHGMRLLENVDIRE